MLERYQELFDDDARLARFLSVSPATLYRWLNGAEMTSTAARLVAVLDAVAEASPSLFAHITGPYRKPVQVRLSKQRTPMVQVKPIAPSRFDAPRGTVYSRADYDRGAYDHLFTDMTDGEFAAFKAKLR